MAKQVTITLQDDLDGGRADETVRFAFGDTAYEIDLSSKNASILREQFAPFIEHARRARAGQRPRSASRTAASRQRSVEIRAWAKVQGIPVSERGRIPTGVVEQYETAARAR